MTSRYVVRAHLAVPTERESAVNTAVLVDLFWAQAAPADGLDHVRATTEPLAGVAVLLILRAPSEIAAFEAAERISTRALRTPALRNRVIRDLDVLPLSELMNVTGDSRS